MKKFQIFRTLETARFSGQLTLANTAEQQWSFFYYQGASIYVTGGNHSVRRWRRNVALHCPHMAVHRMLWYFDLAKLEPSKFAFGWEYALLNLWISREKITTEQANKLLHAIAVEVMFEIAQAGGITEQIQQESIAIQIDALALNEAIRLNLTDAIAEAQLRWQSWQAAGLAPCVPHKAPVIRQPEPLQERSPILYQHLSSLLTGQNTLYDLATQTKRDVVEVTASLLPCVQLGWIDLVDLPDFPIPLLRQDLSPSLPPPLPESKAVKSALIACIDDSSLVRSTMEKLMISAGHEFIGIADPLRAIGILLARKPDLIFLDLVMPNASGHEICQQIRKLSYFKKTPIVILTGSDGYVNRLQSSFVGASAFLTKPLDAKAVFSVIHNFLNQDTT